MKIDCSEQVLFKFPWFLGTSSLFSIGLLFETVRIYFELLEKLFLYSNSIGRGNLAQGAYCSRFSKYMLNTYQNIKKKLEKKFARASRYSMCLQVVSRKTNNFCPVCKKTKFGAKKRFSRVFFLSFMYFVKLGIPVWNVET